MNNRSESWNNWRDQSQQRRDNFQANRDQRWDNMQNAREDRQAWRDQARGDWQEHRQDMWDYRYDRAEEVWDRAGDFYDNYFDDRWWGSYGWGHGYYGSYAPNPWWWWAGAGWSALSGFVHTVSSEPSYADYGSTVVYEGDTVYVNNQPQPVEQYVQPAVELATNVEQPPPPVPPQSGQAEEWMPLGVFALVQEERGDPVMLFQLSVSRSGVISGAYESALTSDQQTVAGQVDPKTQQAAWRVGENRNTIYITSLPNLTQDASPITLYFGDKRTQTWLLVRLPEPAAAKEGAKPPTIERTVPPVKPAAAPAKS